MSSTAYVLDLDRGDFQQGLENTLNNILGVKPDEKLVVVSSYLDPEKWSGIDPKELRYRRESYTIAQFLYLTALKLGCKGARFIDYLSTCRNGAEPPPDIAGIIPMLAGEDAPMIMMPWDSLTHTNVRKEACSRGSRIMSSPHFTADMMRNGGPMCVDYNKVREVSARVAEVIKGAEHEHIWAPNGTDIEVYFIKGAPAVVDPRDLSVVSSDPLERYGNFPAGEAFRAIQPRPESNGTIVGYFKGEEVKVKVEGGCAVEVMSNNRASEDLRKDLFGEESPEFAKRRQLCEDGTGTNMFLEADIEKWLYSTLTAEKIPGKHLAFGNNAGFGGTNDPQYHQDLIILGATAELSNGQRYIVDGKLQV